MSALSLADQYPSMVQYLESLETEERIKFHSHLVERAPNREIDDIRREEEEEEDKKEDDANADSIISNGVASLRHRGLKEFSLQLLPSIEEPSLTFMNLTKLDVSNNELSTLPGLSSLSNLEILCIKRNWFGALPSDIGQLSKLREIDASRNFLKPKNDSLHFDQLKSLSHLKLLDVSLNQKCRTAEHRTFIQKSLLPLANVEVRVTIWQEASNAQHNCIGSSAATRNPTFLRSQLEPWGTVNLRRRLVRDFGVEPTDPAVVDRAGVMRMLLDCYQKEGMLRHDNNDSNANDLNMGVGVRRTVKIDGVPVRKELLKELLEELRSWRGNRKRGGCSRNRERPSINAECYMILCAPTAGSVASAPANDDDQNGTSKDDNDDNNNNNNNNISRRDKRRAKKMQGNTKLWNLALKAMKETDPQFASSCSEIAVTYGFTGSPHIDRQNSSPFYGLALGDFTEGTGGIMVECSARVVAEVNTRNRLGRVDGRHPHWVGEYDCEGEERFSLIYYDTLSAYQPPGPAIFTTGFY